MLLAIQIAVVIEPDHFDTTHRMDALWCIMSQGMTVGHATLFAHLINDGFP